MHFFSQPIQYSKIAPSTVLSESGALLDDTKKELETHHDVMSRILFVYAKVPFYFFLYVEDSNYIGIQSVVESWDSLCTRHE